MAAARSIVLSCLLLLSLWTASAPAAGSPAIDQAESTAAFQRAALDSIRNELTIPSLSSELLAQHRARLDEIRAAAQAAAAALEAPGADITLQIDQLGPPPADGASELPAIAAQRQELNEDLQRLEGARKQLELIAVEAEQLIGRAAAMQRDLFFSRIFESHRSILNPLLWYEGGREAGNLAERVAALFASWWRETGSLAAPAHLLLLASILLAAFGALGYGRRWLLTKFRLISAAPGEPDDLARLWRAVRSALMAILVIVALGLSIYLTGTAAGLVTPRLTLLLNAAATFALNAIAVAVLAARMAAPRQPAWRLIDVDEEAARRFVILVTISAVAASAEQALSGLAAALYVSISFSVGQSALSAVILLPAIALLMLTLQEQAGAGLRQRYYLGWARRVAPLVWLLLAIAAIALVLGYVALGNFIARQIYETSVVVTALALLHHLSDAVIAASFDPQSRVGQGLRRLTGLGERGIERLGLLLRTLIDLLLVLIGVPLLLVAWTVTWIDVGSWINTAVSGFRVGDVTVSPASVVLALVILGLGAASTRLFARWLDARILTETRLDKGVQDSVRKGAVYAGYTIAAGFALTAAGLDFSNLAIVAGALGVGIGFGLQSIVNNFVSGLILLAERPVRVGDWVQLAAGEGMVKRINVRSTEIETFDNCSIIVPNSNLITDPVKNWTHGDSMGRFLVQVSVGAKSDPQAVRELLLSLAREHPLVLTFPEPQVLLSAMSAEAMNFELRAFVADIFLGAATASDLRFAILAAFRERGIDLSVPMQEIRLRRNA